MRRCAVFASLCYAVFVAPGVVLWAQEDGSVEFLEPVPGQPPAWIWGPDPSFWFHVNPSGQGGVTQCKLLVGDPLNGQEFIHHYPEWDHDEQGTWEPINVPNGDCTLTAEAYHFAQLIGSDSVGVYVNNKPVYITVGGGAGGGGTGPPPSGDPPPEDPPPEDPPPGGPPPGG